MVTTAIKLARSLDGQATQSRLTGGPREVGFGFVVPSWHMAP
jgi:hypothetical protein